MPNSYILITGASSGMGEATAKLLSQEHNIIVHGRDLDRLKAVAKECVQHGKAILIFPYDLVNVQTLALDLKAFLLENNAKVDSFIHYAGMIDLLPISKTKYSKGLEVMNVNYFSAVEIISTLLKRKINSDILKRIILVSSIAVKVAMKYQPHYVASKGAIEALTATLAFELAPHITVNCIVPGSFQTRITNTIFMDINAINEYKPNTLLASGKVDEIAKVARFLLSDDAQYITGEHLNVDGGERFIFHS